MKPMEFFDTILSKAKLLKHPNKMYSLNSIQSHGTDKLGTTTISSNYSDWSHPGSGKKIQLFHRINAQGKVIDSEHPNFLKEDLGPLVATAAGVGAVALARKILLRHKDKTEAARRKKLAKNSAEFAKKIDKGYYREEIDSQGVEIAPQRGRIRRNKKHSRPPKEAAIVAEQIVNEAVAKTLASTLQRGRSTSNSLSRSPNSNRSSNSTINNIKQRMQNLKLQQANLRRQAAQAKLNAIQQKARNTLNNK
jgi:hypothetical protein